jgi:serine protease
MKQFIILLILFGCWAMAGWGQVVSPTMPGKLIIKLKEGGSMAAVQPALRVLGASSVSQKFPYTQAPNPEQPGSVNLRLLYQLDVPAPINLAKARAMLLASGAVEYVEPLYIREPLYQTNDPRADSVSGSQYHLRLIKAYRAWDFTKGDTSVVIGMTDTGFRLSHEDLVRQIKYNYADPINGVDDDGDGYIDNFRGWDMSNDNNDPSYESFAGHGSLTAGLAAGQADNGKGIAGVGFRCKWLPLQVFSGLTTGRFAGYEAIVYAADHGCRVINMSWGGVGGYSRFEQDVCTYAAVNRDAVLVASAGNTPANVLFYPASYEHVLSVGATDGNDNITGFSTYNPRVDLAAPGEEVRSIGGGNQASIAGPPDADYWVGTGTSFSAPQVAGAAALVRARFPLLTAEQVGAQLRQAADADIYTQPANISYVGLLGTGRLNVARAVASPNQWEVRVVTSTFAPARPTGYAPGDTFRLATTVRNLLLPVEGLTVTLTSLSPYLTVRQGTFAVGNLATLATANNAVAPFRLAVAASGVPINTLVLVRYHFAGRNGYQSDQYANITLNPDFVQLDAGNLSLSLTSRGNLGYDDPTAALGLGASYLGGPALLSEGGLLLATSPTRVADRLRSTSGAVRQSFFSLAQVVRRTPGPRADQEARGTFRDSLPDPLRPRSVGVRVRQHGQSWAAPASRRNVIVLDYSLRNLTADTLKPLYAGIFTDWDLPGNPARNVARWDSVNRVSYYYDPVASDVYTGIQVLGSGAAGVYAINNAAPPGGAVYLADGFSPAEKYLALSSGFGRAHREAGATSGTDVSAVVSTLVPRLAPGDSATVAFAVLAAPSLAELQAAAQAATAAYAQQVLATVAGAASPAWQIYPNPTTGRVRIDRPSAAVGAPVQLFDALGRLVLTAVLPSSGELDLSSLMPGLYSLRSPGTGFVQRIERR